jgi:hypothetical protein
MKVQMEHNFKIICSPTYLSSSCANACTMNVLAQTMGTVRVLLVILEDPITPPPKLFIMKVFSCLTSDGSSYTKGSPAHNILLSWASVISFMGFPLWQAAATQISDAVVFPLFLSPKATGI